MFNRVLTVCVGNICRSPTAEILLREALPNPHFVISSAGIGALVGKPVDATAARVLIAHGHAVHEHQARQLSRAMLHEADLVLVMEKPHLEHVLQMAPEARGKVFLLGKWQGDHVIPDPYRQDEAAFEATYQKIAKGIAAWASRINQ